MRRSHQKGEGIAGTPREPCRGLLCRDCHRYAPQSQLQSDPKPSGRCAECGVGVDAKMVAFCRFNSRKFEGGIVDNLALVEADNDLALTWVDFHDLPDVAIEHVFTSLLWVRFVIFIFSVVRRRLTASSNAANNAWPASLPTPEPTIPKPE